MASGLEILGATASALQIAGQIIVLGNRLLEKPKDTIAIRILCADAKKYIAHLQRWETEVSDDVDVVDACHDLRQKLSAIVVEVEGLKRRHILNRFATSLKLYKPEFREKFADALEEFKFRMCIQSRRSVDEMDHKLDGMTRKMDELRVTSKTLEAIPGVDDAITKVREKITGMSRDMHNITASIEQVRSSLDKFENIASALPQIKNAITEEGKITRETIQQSTATVVEHLDTIETQLQGNESMIRIKTEILPKKSPLIRYDGATPEMKPRFRLWSLDNASETDRPGPCGIYGGLELSSICLPHTYDETVSKPSVAEDVDEDIQAKKLDRIAEVDPYVALAKRGNYLDELHELYVPPDIAEQIRTVLPRESQVEALRIARTLSQEYRYFLFMQVLQQKAFTLPKLHLLEDMERAMLALHAEKLKVEIVFVMGTRTFDNVKFKYGFVVLITRYE
jgi:hypothetical protein